MLCACIDIGSNTTRVLVADVVDGTLTEVLAKRAFTRLGRELRASGVVGRAKIAEIAGIVTEQRELAERVGAERVRVVATAAIRGAANRDELLEVVEARSGVAVRVLDGSEEARLAFIGATRTLRRAPKGTVGVVDVGGGSSEIALGSMRDGVTWSASFRIGSGFLADSYLRSDPPAATELDRMREHAGGVFEGLGLPQPDLGVAVGGSATSLRRLVGAVIDPDSVARGLRVLSSAPAEQVARDFDLDPERVRLLPAGLVILAECSAVLGVPLQIGRGGLREGVCIELAAVA